LGFEDGVEGGRSFAFDDDFVVDQEIESELGVEFFPFVDDRYRYLPGYGEPSMFNFIGESFFVDPFEKAGASEGSMDFDSGTDDDGADFVFGDVEVSGGCHLRTLAWFD
jgi:hypothetical protein